MKAWKAWIASLTLTLGSALAAPTLVNVSGTTYVNPYDFAAAYGFSIEGASTGPTWILRRGTTVLRLTSGSNAGLLDGRRVTLSKPVGFARGTLLAPFADLVRLLNVPTTTVAPRPQAPAATPRPSTSARLPTPPAATTRTGPSVQPPVPPVSSGPEPRPVPTPRVRDPMEPYVVQSRVALRLGALDTPVATVPLDGREVGVVAAVDACRAALAADIGIASDVRFGQRPSVFVHPENVFSVRGSVESESDGRALLPFTCLMQVRDGRFVVTVATRPAP